MRVSRLFEIIYVLMNRRTTTAKELADHFEVSTRTIQRDIEVLMQAGIPLYTKRGKGGGISLLEGYVLDKTVLTQAERSHILMALQSLPVDKADVQGVRTRLLSLFDRPEDDWIEVDFSRWGHSSGDTERFNVLKGAIMGTRAISFEYISSQGKRSVRTAYPLKLVFKSRAWYLQAFCLMRDDYRSFRVNRMIGICETDDLFDRSNYTVPFLERSGTNPEGMHLLELVFQPQAASRIYDEFDSDCIEPSDEGLFHVFTRYPNEDYLYRFLASFGDAVDIVGPEYVRNEVHRRRQKKYEMAEE